MSWLLRFAGAPAAPWVLLAIVVAIGASHVWAHFHWVAVGVAQEQAAQAKAIATAAEKIRRDHEADLKQRGWQDMTEATAARAARKELEERLAQLASIKPETLIKTVKVRDEKGCTRPVVSLGADFWLRYRTAGGQLAEADPATADPVHSRM